MVTTLRPRSGMALTLSEDQYRYGEGPILFLVTNILGSCRYDNAPWWILEGQCAHGTPENHGGWYTRELYVDSAAVTAASVNKYLEVFPK